MVQYTCNTCSVSLDDQEMLKHLSSTRHKSVIHSPTQETLECESCQDSNIHQLIIIRYGGQDISLLCQTCFQKEQDKPSTQYTLNNGSILKNFENYLKIRDLECGLCGNDSHLQIDKNQPDFVVCYKCIQNNELQSKRDFIKESDDNFLYVFLGIKEHVKSSKPLKKRTRQVGRGKKGKGRFGKGKPSTGGPKRIGTPSEHNTTLRSFQALSKNQVDKIKPKDEINEPPQNIVKVDKKPDNKNGKFNGKSSPRPVGSKPPGSKFDKGPRSSGFKTETSRPTGPYKPTGSKPTGPKTTGPKTGSSKTSAPKTSGPKPTGPKTAGTKTTGPKSSKPASNDSKDLTTNITEKIEDLQISDKTKPETKNSSNNKNKDNSKPRVNGKDQSTGKSTGKSANKPGRSSDKLDKQTDKPGRHSDKPTRKPTEKPERKSNGPSKEPIKSNDKSKLQGKTGKIDNKFNKPKSPKDSKGKPTSKIDDKNQTKSTNPPIKKESTPVVEEDYEELEHIPKYLSNKPKLSYDSLDEYFKEMCFHLYLEEKLSSQPITNFHTEWHVDNKNLFKVTIPFTEEIENLIPPKLRNLGKLPFSMNQSIFVAKSNDKDNIWDCFVKDLNLIKRNGKKIELLLELYKWNNSENFPIGSSNLSIIPCSATITRILFAMSRISNERFIKMLLGKDPIRQINFKNRLQFTKDTFNDSQKEAIQHVLNNAITVLQGPPGTGKTSTIYEIILQLFRNLKTWPILVVAASNIAIDNIAEKLKADDDLNILRIVSTEKEKEYNEKHHLYDVCLHQQIFQRLPEQNKQIALDLRYNRKPVSQNQYKKLLTIQNSIIEKLVAQAQVILTTSVVAGGYQLKNLKKLPVVIMDESTQSSEATSLIPLSMPGVDKFVFVGDDKQLSSFSEVPYLEQSLFERVLNNGTYRNPHMLNVQYRMHPKISEFPIKRFYRNLLSNGVTEEDRFIEGINPLVFVDYGSIHQESKVSNFKRFNGGGYTFTNHGEAKLILKILKDLIFTKNINKEDISVITPYSAQRDLLATTFQKDDLINPNNEDIEEEVDEDSLTNKKPTTIKTICNIMVSSIDAFQGREKNFIIFSCVRSNEESKIGFVKDERRLNVALTRARNGLILVGNKQCMSLGDPLWKELTDHLESNDSIVTPESLNL
ncbi:putative ATP-dependent RNA helicase [Wickerhamomyces ciferrii]|uniref:ATP-dependent RNA helicase n=1 Tax=Wickerhamomyces ciferrii (strain ATCC 14091 / BCRC 22168 / CBS 111 / JCM 3599 / NBRC 0793 / NRRL Y-1031 F-60-10) TaxID=1206466 RepID=K0KQH2_WICCF|nr:putative ATP-dependent RNA helicase [Wickerhamomyces ciferrii]CCH44397.1 putative ATP-dependent RNA helicase [Wickerhamomyces ciferrii]